MKINVPKIHFIKIIKLYLIIYIWIQNIYFMLH
jgi:hypothetical protein